MGMGMGWDGMIRSIYRTTKMNYFVWSVGRTVLTVQVSECYDRMIDIVILGVMRLPFGNNS